MVRLRSRRQVHFLRDFPLSSLLLLSFSSFLSSLVAPIRASPRIIRYFPSENTPGSKSKMRRGGRWRDPFVSSWLSCPAVRLLYFPSLFSSSAPDVLCYIYKRCRTLRSLPSFIFRHRAISARSMHREKPMRIDRENRFSCGLVSISASLLSLYRVLLKFIGLPTLYSVCFVYPFLSFYRVDTRANLE